MNQLQILLKNYNDYIFAHEADFIKTFLAGGDIWTIINVWFNEHTVCVKYVHNESEMPVTDTIPIDEFFEWIIT